MEEGFIKDTLELILKEIQTILKVSYVFMVGIGMLFQYQKYSIFGINIFDYADLLEFLIAPFSDWTIIIFSLGSLIFTYLIFKVDGLFKKKLPKLYTKTSFGWDKKPWYNTFRYFTFTFVFLTYLYGASQAYAKNKEEKIRTQTPIQIEYVNNQTTTGLRIGQTKNTLFLLKDNIVKALPIQGNIKHIRLHKYSPKSTKNTITK